MKIWGCLFLVSKPGSHSSIKIPSSQYGDFIKRRQYPNCLVLIMENQYLKIFFVLRRSPDLFGCSCFREHDGVSHYNRMELQCIYPSCDPLVIKSPVSDNSTIPATILQLVDMIQPGPVLCYHNQPPKWFPVSSQEYWNTRPAKEDLCCMQSFVSYIRADCRFTFVMKSLIGWAQA